MIQFRGKTIRYASRSDWWGLVESGQWEPNTFDVIERFISPGKVFLDVGAWNGVCSIYANLLGGECHSIEPDRTALNELLDNFSMNNIKSPVYNYAISDYTGFTEISNEIGAMGNSNTSLLSRYEKEDKTPVRCFTLQDFIEKNNIKPDLIKVDTEGSEALIIPASIEILKKCNCPLYLSLHPYWLTEEQTKNIFEALEQVYTKSETFDSANKEILYLP
jgi:FkbM family methyltransferase